MDNKTITINEDKLESIKIMLKLYRSVVRNIDSELGDWDEELYISCRRRLSDLVDGIIDFESKSYEQRLFDRIFTFHGDLEMLNIMEKALCFVKKCADDGQKYYEILEPLFFSKSRFTNEDVMVMVNMSRATYFRYLKKAYLSFYKYLVIAMKQENRAISKEWFA